MKHYVGRRNPDGMCTVLVVDGNDRWPLPLRLDLANHSPTGFEWGYGGSGPAQLSLVLLADALQDDRQAMLLHQEYKFRVIGRLPRPGFTLEADEIAKIASELWIEQGD